MNEELTKDEIEALHIIEWLEPVGRLTDLIYGYDLSQGSTQAWWDSISPIAF